MKPRKKINYRSKKMADKYRTERIPIVVEMLAQNPLCQRCHQNQAVDVHELKSRARGGSITDKENLVVVCRPCHSWITTNPKLAREQGWLKNSWD